MNVNEKLKTLLEGPTGLKVDQDEHDGNDDKYIIFSYADERPETFADNKPDSDTVYLNIQLITPKNFNYMKLKHKIRDLLEDADFIVTSIRSFLGDVYFGTEKTRQTVLEVKYTEQRMEES